MAARSGEALNNSDVKATLELFLHLDNTFSKDAAKQNNIPQDNKRRARLRAYGQLAELLETTRACYASKQNELALEVRVKHFFFKFEINTFTYRFPKFYGKFTVIKI